MISRFFKCCKCEHEFDSDELGRIYVLTDHETGVVVESEINKCSDCGSTDVEYLTGDDGPMDLYDYD